MENEADIKKAGGFRIWHLTCEHIQKIGRMTQVRRRCDGRLVVSDTVPGRNKGGKSGDESNAHPCRCFNRILSDVRVMVRQHGDRCL